ncbi:MAG: class I SAM-dependent methyltransferase [Geminicoccaceae bacterium]
MWARLIDHLVCHKSAEPFELVPLEERAIDLDPVWRRKLEALGIDPQGADRWIETGLLCDRKARLWFPISHGLPVLLPYQTDAHSEMLRNYGDVIRKLGEDFRAAADDPAPGERFVLESFSTEWRDYDDSEVLWTWSIEERRAFFLEEIGAAELTGAERSFVEIGCGLGLVTSLAATELGLDAIGVDLSLAAMRAAQRCRTNPLTHFIQASIWALPFRRSSFDIVYSHGVLHHTHDTERAFSGVAALASPGGRTYVWVYGPGRARGSPLRRAVFPIEQVVRPLLARLPAALANIVLYPIALGYWALNRWHRARGGLRQRYDLRRALHAARDRFTPAFAHIHETDEVRGWFERAGFSGLHVLSQEEVAPASRESVAQSVAIRGIRSGAEAPVARARPNPGSSAPIADEREESRGDDARYPDLVAHAR